VCVAVRARLPITGTSCGRIRMGALDTPPWLMQASTRIRNTGTCRVLQQQYFLRLRLPQCRQRPPAAPGRGCFRSPTAPFHPPPWHTLEPMSSRSPLSVGSLRLHRKVLQLLATHMVCQLGSQGSSIPVQTRCMLPHQLLLGFMATRTGINLKMMPRPNCNFDTVKDWPSF